MSNFSEKRKRRRDEIRVKSLVRAFHELPKEDIEAISNADESQALRWGRHLLALLEEKRQGKKVRFTSLREFQELEKAAGMKEKS